MFNLKKTFFLSLCLILLSSSSLFATITFNNIASQKTKAPQGSSKLSVLYYSLHDSGGDIIKKFTIKNSSPTVNFGALNNTGINTVYIYKDTAGNQKFDANTSTLLYSYTFPAPQGDTYTAILSDSQTISLADNTDTGFFIVYDIGSVAQINASTNIQLISFENSLGTVYTAAVNSQDVLITGLIDQTYTNVAPSIVVPGQTGVKMLKITLQAAGEDIRGDSTYPLTLTIKNADGNFANTAGDLTGVTSVYLYNDGDRNGVLSGDELISYITGTAFSSKTEAIFSLTNLTVTKNTPIDLYVLYDIGDKMPVTSDTKIAAQLTAFSGTGADSLSTITLTRALPQIAVEPRVGGLSYDSLTSIVPSDTSFGPGTSVPILGFKLRANNISVTLNKITLDNTGTIQYITNSTDTSGVTKIRIYEDTNQDYEYNGDGLGDTLVGQLNLGNGGGQSKTSAPVLITNGCFIPTTNNGSDVDNAKMFFVVYDLGESISAGTTSSSNVIANVLLENALASASITTASVKLVGTLPAAASPAAEVNIYKINIRAKDVITLAPATVAQGQIKVPMVYLKLWTEAATKATVLQLLNNKGSFLDNNTGVAKVWIYRDTNNDMILNNDDVLLSATSTFNTTLRADMPKFDLPQGDNNLFICYDIGQSAVLSTNNIACQLDNIVATGDATNISFGGERPVPKIPAITAVTSALLGIDYVQVDTTNVTNSSGTFNILVKISNKTSVPVSLTDLLPRFYLTETNKLVKSGQDISYEFTITPQINFPVTINNSDSLTVTFKVLPSHLITTGSVIIDATAKYKVSTDNYAMLIRYKSSSTDWQLAAATYAQISLYSTLTKYAWRLSDFIDQIKVEYGSQSISFKNYDAVPANSNFVIYFKNKGSFLDESSFTVLLNDATLSATQNAASPIYPTFTIDKAEGTLKIYNIGENSGELKITVRDLSGNRLTETDTDATLSFYIARQIKIYNFLCYPNPYRINGQPLKFGFNITQPGQAKLYMYNSLGQMVWSYTIDCPLLGYQEITWDGLINNRYLGSGIYVIKLVVQDQLSNTDSKTTKLAIY